MKILFITSALGIDYLSDCVFHGLVTLGYDVTDSKYLWYLSQPLTNEQKLNLYGKGFTLAGNLPDRSNIDRNNLQERIKQKQFDCIIYGSIHRSEDYLNLVLSTYKRQQIIFIDGQDQFPTIKTQLLDKGIYYRRQLKDNSALPISFSIPKQKIIKIQVSKELQVATIIPGKRQTYIYNNQNDYYLGYAKSMFGITCKKAGWDCMRHYEIIANKCLPYFYNFENCPRTIMSNWPNELQAQANNIFVTKKFNNYNIILQQFFNYCKQNLTTEQSVINILKRISI